MTTSPSNYSPPSQRSTRASQSDSPANPLPRPPITRARPQLSCTPCRQGKLKCNREHPVCDQCAKRSREDACQYVPPPSRNKQTQNMRGRIRNLESLVVSLINQKTAQQDEDSQRERSSSSDQPRATTELEEPEDEVNAATFGQLRINNSGTNAETKYVGAGHWSTILKEIEEVKDSLEGEDGDPLADEDDDESEHANLSWNTFADRSTVTMGMPDRMTKAELLRAIPQKDYVDRLLPLFFNSVDPIVYVIHGPTFQDEYKRFWRDPSKTPVMWIGLLYSAMALGIALGSRNPAINPHSPNIHHVDRSPFNDSDNMMQSIFRYQKLAASAIALGDIDNCLPYTLEALMVYTRCEFLGNENYQSKIWLAHGVLTRVGLRMGYHRDPSHHKGMSPFQGEMRRRVWHMLNMMDTLISFAIGLPNGIRHIEHDVRLPLNIFDTDFSVNSEELPKPRPFTELTPSTYVICKIRLCGVFGEAAELYQKVLPPKHTAILALDKKLEEAHDLVPLGLRVRPLEESITDTPMIVMSRFTLELLYQKSRVVLHRNYLRAGQSDPRFQKSREICVDASMEILRLQSVIFNACQPGGRLNQVWWYMATLTTYDFLLAAMVLCLELAHLHAQSREAGAIESPHFHPMLSLLETTYEIWERQTNKFQESIRGAGIIKAVVKRFAGPPGSGTQSHDSGNSTFGIDSGLYPEPFSASDPSIEDLGPQIWDSLSSSASQHNEFTLPSDIDWGMWDSTTQNQPNILPQINLQVHSEPYIDHWNQVTRGAGNVLDSMFGFQEPLIPYGGCGPSPGPQTSNS